MPSPLKITDRQLLAEIESGLTPAAIARKYGLSRGSLTPRLTKLQQGMAVSTSLGPPDIVQQYTQGQIRIFEELRKAIGRINKLGDAYERWLTDPDNPDQYDIGPRSHEIKVIYTDDSDDKPKAKKATLSELLNMIEASGKTVVSAESKHADPRVEMRNSMAEIRHFMELALELDDRLRQQKRMDTLERGIVDILQNADPERALALRRELRKLMVVSEPGE